MVATPSSVSLTYTGSNASGSRFIKITVPAQSGNPAASFETSLSSAGYTSGSCVLDSIVQLVDAQVRSGSTSGTISVSVT